MREGSVFRRCGRCDKRLPKGARRCPCGHDRATWAFIVDLEVAGEKRRQLRRQGFATRELAIAEMRKLQEERAAGTWVEPNRLTVRVYLERWIKTLALQEAVRRNTRDEWAGHVRSHLIPRLGTVLLQQLTTPQIRAAYGEMRVSGHQRTGGPLAPKSVWNIHRCLHRALADAVKDGLLKANPAAGAMALPMERPDISFWTPAQVAEFMAYVDSTLDLQHQALYRLALQTGMRRGELLGLRWIDLDLDRLRVTVRQQLARREDISAPKTRAGRRTIDLSADVVAALRAQWDAQMFQRRAWSDAYEDQGLVFTRENGTPHDPRVVTHRFANHVSRSGVKRIRFHDLRHTSAVLGLRVWGEGIDELSKRLGHTSVAFTIDTYGGLLPQRGRAVAAAFDAMLTSRDRSVTVRDEG
jgi:integrase